MITDHAVKLEFDHAAALLAQHFNLPIDRLNARYGETRQGQESLIELFRGAVTEHQELLQSQQMAEHYRAPIIIVSVLFGIGSFVAGYPALALAAILPFTANEILPRMAARDLQHKLDQIKSTLEADA